LSPDSITAVGAASQWRRPLAIVGLPWAGKPRPYIKIIEGFKYIIPLKSEYLGLVGKVYQGHPGADLGPGREVVFSHHPGLGAGFANQNAGAPLHQELPIGDEFVAGGGLDPLRKGEVGEIDGIINQEDHHFMPLVLGDLGELETAHGPGGVLGTAGQHEQELAHGLLLKN